MRKGNAEQRTGDGRTGRKVTLAEKVGFLSRPEIYPDDSTRVDVVETHMSWVFLSKSLAHKLKKPVHYDFLDFRSLEARRRNCNEEVRLNRRLAAEIYIGAIPLTLEAMGRLRLDGEGEAVDWLVRMHRLPAERMLDRAIVNATVTDSDLMAVARLLAEFYSGADRPDISAVDFRRRLTTAIEQNRQELESPEFDLPVSRIDAISQALQKMLTSHPTLFERRIQEGCLVEGHGDLKPEHVFLGRKPAVIDCLEFNRDLRILDRVDELAYLAVECERLGSADTGNAILKACCGFLDDDPPERLIHFYKAHRALLRARLAIAHLRDDDVREPGKWRPSALRFLKLAETYSRRVG